MLLRARVRQRGRSNLRLHCSRPARQYSPRTHANLPRLDENRTASRGHPDGRCRGSFVRDDPSGAFQSHAGEPVDDADLVSQATRAPDTGSPLQGPRLRRPGRAIPRASPRSPWRPVFPRLQLADPICSIRRSRAVADPEALPLVVAPLRTNPLQSCWRSWLESDCHTDTRADVCQRRSPTRRGDGRSVVSLVRQA